MNYLRLAVSAAVFISLFGVSFAQDSAEDARAEVTSSQEAPAAHSDAPKHLKFYSVQMRDNIDRIETMRGVVELQTERIMSLDGQAEKCNRRITKTIDFSWDRTSDSYKFTTRPNSKIEYFDIGAKTSFFKNASEKPNSLPKEESSVKNPNGTISTSPLEITRDKDGKLRKLYVSSSKKTDFWPRRSLSLSKEYWPDHIFRIAKIAELPNYLDSTIGIDNQIHCVNTKSKPEVEGTPGIWEYKFDSTKKFMLISYSETGLSRKPEIGKWENRITIEYENFAGIEIPIAWEKEALVSGKTISIDRLRYSKLVVNKPISSDEFKLQALSPADGDILINKESGERFRILDEGKALLNHLDIPVLPAKGKE